MGYNPKGRSNIELLKCKLYNKPRKRKRMRLYRLRINHLTIILGISKVLPKVSSPILIVHKAIKKYLNSISIRKTINNL